MNNLLERIWGAVESFARPAQIAIVLWVVSGIQLFNLFGIVDVFGVENDIAKWKFWLLTTFLLSGLLLLTTIGFFIWRFSSKHSKRIWMNFTASRLGISFEAEAILVFLTENRPDPVHLRSAHPAVRELRLHRLITSTMAVYFGDCQDYRMTEAGVARAAVSVLLDPSDDDIDRIQEVVAEACEIPMKMRNSWLAR
ncbi:hypothetical protein GV827_02495 [Sulfitobacter sp. JBTF-M27]|uniref:Uncharacterized protein n=1 Tax=Sulfitobacter sediminilitoris TaxID=2698830 RepID=A0A6P0C5A0_9RHOB|nr:hypothetical protein [Sulfitobacter sediminilitoris]NEK21272.1 hypothetical protein [Sulfitobacter sediminilitoris]